MPYLSAPAAAARATTHLRHQATVTVSAACIRDLIQSNYLPANSDGLTRSKDIDRVFANARVLDGSDRFALRVSIGPLAPSIAVDPRPYGPRSWVGIDFANSNGMTKKQQRDGYVGVWPLSDREIQTAALHAAPLLPAIKGLVDANLIRIVTGGALDLTTGRRWLQTRKLTPAERNELLPQDATAAWITIPRGRISELTQL